MFGGYFYNVKVGGGQMYTIFISAEPTKGIVNNNDLRKLTYYGGNDSWDYGGLQITDGNDKRILAFIEGKIKSEMGIEEGIPLTHVGSKEGDVNPKKNIPLTHVGSKEGDGLPSHVKEPSLPLNKKVIPENGDEEIERATSLEKLFTTPEGYEPINSLEDLISQAIDIARKYDYRSGEIGRAAAHIARRFDLPKHN